MNSAKKEDRAKKKMEKKMELHMDCFLQLISRLMVIGCRRQVGPG